MHWTLKHIVFFISNLIICQKILLSFVIDTNLYTKNIDNFIFILLYSVTTTQSMVLVIILVTFKIFIL